MVFNSSNQVSVLNIYKTKNHKSFKNGVWIVNRNVVQYSSFLLVNQAEKSTKAEFLVLLNRQYKKDQTAMPSEFRCFVKHKKPDEVIYVKTVISIVKTVFMPIETFDRFVWKIQCDLDNVNYAIENLELALVYLDDFKLNTNEYQYLAFHEPRIFNLAASKAKAVALCVHMMRLPTGGHLSYKKLVDWLIVQKHIGIARVRIYFYRVGRDIEKNLLAKFGNDFIEIVHYSTAFEDVCHKQIADIKAEPGNDVVRKLYYDCQTTFDRHFNMSRGKTYNSQERINDNDCFINFRYTHEYVTNYDVDELIIPRIYETAKQQINCEERRRTTSNSSRLSLYDFAKINFQHTDESKTAALLFNHVVFVPYDFLSFENGSNGEISVLISTTTAESASRYLKINVESNLKEKFQRAFEVAQCFKRILANSSSMHSRFAYAFSFSEKTQEGKKEFKYFRFQYF
jgi:hypothetical protein